MGFEYISLPKVKRAIENASGQITIEIDSPGGEAWEGLKIYDYLKQQKKTIKTVNVGLCASAATLIYCAGDKRLAYENSVFMRHNAEGGIYGKQEDVESYAASMKITNDAILSVYQEATGIGLDVLKEKMKVDYYENAEMAKETGLVTDIIYNQKRENIEAALTASFKSIDKYKTIMNMNTETKSLVQKALAASMEAATRLNQSSRYH